MMILTRRIQLVSTNSERKALMQWMVSKLEENGSDNKIAAEAIEQFPSTFRKAHRRENRK